MKIAISGKGGAGKTLLSALLSRSFAKDGYDVIAIDADPDANLATALGFPAEMEIKPLSKMDKLIKERTYTGNDASSDYFKLNPYVTDIPDTFSVKHEGIRLIVMGQVKGGGAGCYCPENSLLSALVAHLMLARNEAVIMDMAAGVEHLNRGTARRVDQLIVVTEPSRAGIETTNRVYQLARDIEIKNIAVVGNKIRSSSEKDFIISSLKDVTFLGFIPYDQAIIHAEINNLKLYEASPSINLAVKDIYRKLVGAFKPKSN